MGNKYSQWLPATSEIPSNIEQLKSVLLMNRNFIPVERLEYGDYGLEDAYAKVLTAIQQNKKIALYADYDVDGTMSCVSWIWFFKAIQFDQFVYHIPDRFTEGYGVNLEAIQKLVNVDGAQLIITMDTGITANREAAWCLSQGVEFICTDHHKIQPEKMPDCTILNPKMHPHADYQELCGCGITFVLLRKLAKNFSVPNSVWQDILALAGIATICDVVPLNGVNHKLAKQGVQALGQSTRPVLKELLKAASVLENAEEKDVGFRLGPRINAVGRLEHAHKVVEAFVNEDPKELIHFMGICNERRKKIQIGIVEEARELAKTMLDAPIVFVGGAWHPGVVGIAASKICEENWKPTWLFERKNGICKGSARSIPGFDVTDAMTAVGHLFLKFGGHAAAGGFAFLEENEQAIRQGIIEFAEQMRKAKVDIWQSKIKFDCELPLELADLKLVEQLEHLKPFGHGFEEPRFMINTEIEDVKFYNDKQTGQPRHTAVEVQFNDESTQKIMFFNEVHLELKAGQKRDFLVSLNKNVWRGRTSLNLQGIDYL